MACTIGCAAPNATTVHERTEMYVAEFTLQAKPGHYTEVAALYSAFAADFLLITPHSKPP